MKNQQISQKKRFSDVWETYKPRLITWYMTSTVETRDLLSRLDQYIHLHLCGHRSQLINLLYLDTGNIKKIPIRLAKTQIK